MTNEEFDKLVLDSQYILDLDPNYEYDGNPPWEKKTLERALDYLKTHFDQLKAESKYDLGVPNVCAGPHGSIDIFWKYKDFMLLANVPVDENKVVTYYFEHIIN